jgi:hypothetical protein
MFLRTRLKIDHRNQQLSDFLFMIVTLSIRFNMFFGGFLFQIVSNQAHSDHCVKPPPENIEQERAQDTK